MYNNIYRSTTSTPHHHLQISIVEHSPEIKQVILEHISTHLVLGDTSTKALLWVLHKRHNDIIMG